jgi:enolase
MAFQEIILALISAHSITESVQMGTETYYTLKTVITKKFGPSITGIGNEGGLALPISKPSEALDLFVKVVEKAGNIRRI